MPTEKKAAFLPTQYSFKLDRQRVNKFSGQPDDGLHTGPKHVVVYYISLLIIILLCS